LTIDEAPADRWVEQRQKTGSGLAYEGSYSLRGTYSGTPSGIEARVLDAETLVALTPWRLIDAAPAAGAFAGELTQIPQGGWYLVEARFEDDPAVTARSQGRLGVGMIVAAIGQSNMVKHFTEDEADGSLPAPFAAPHPLSRRLGYGEPAPYLYARPRTADIPVAWGEPTGTGGIRLAENLIAELGVPVLLLDFSLDWSSLEGDWTNVNFVGWTRFAAALDQVGSIEAVLWHQGAVDAHQEGAQHADYKAGLDELYSHITSLTGSRPSGSYGTLPFVLSVQNRGVYDDVFYKDEGYNEVRRAQLEWIAERPWGFAAGSSIDLDLSTQPYSGDGHFWASGYQLMADRYAYGILHAIGQPGYEAGLGGGRILSASISGQVVQVRVAHDQGGKLVLRDPASPLEGFTLTDGEWLVNSGNSLQRNELTIVDARLSDQEPGNWVTLTLAQPPSGPLRLRYLYGQNVFHAKATDAARRANGNILYDDFSYFPGRQGLPINGSTADIEVEPVPRLVVDREGLRVDEGGSASLRVHLSAAPAGSVMVEGQLFGDPDLTFSGPTALYFDADTWQVDQALTFAAAADADALDGRGLLRLQAAGHQSQAVSLEESDASPSIVPSSSELALSLNGGTADLGIHLSRAPSSPVVLVATSTDPIFLGVAPMELTFTSANWQNEQYLRLSGLGGAAGTLALQMSVNAAASDDAWDAVTANVAVELLGPDTRLLLHLPLDETSGSVAFDLSGQGHHAALGSDVVLGRGGISGNAIETTAPGGSAGNNADGLTLADFSAGASFEELSVALWYQLAPGVHDGYFFHWGGTYETPNAISAFLDADTGIRVRVHDAADTSSLLLVAPAGFADNAWHHLAITKSVQGIAVYFDGAAVAASNSMGVGPLTPARGAALGLNETGTYGLAALFDEFRIWPRQLTAGDVASLYAAGAAASISVVLEPVAARAAGAAWRLESGPNTSWQVSGESVSGLPTGTYRVLFADLADWARPATQEVAILPGAQSLAATYASLPPLSPRLHLRFEETAASLAADDSGHRQDATYGADVLRGEPGVLGFGARTTGPGGSAGNLADVVANDHLLGGESLQELSVVFWYRLPAGAHDGYLFSWGGSNNAPSHVSAFLDVGNGLRVRVHTASDTSSVVQVAPAGFDNTSWHHLAIVKDAAGTRIHFDGGLVASSTLGSAALQTSGLFRLGSNELGTYGIAATFDELQIFSRALAGSEVSQFLAIPVTGELEVDLFPATVVGLGARWRLNGQPEWHASGERVPLNGGIYTVEAEEVAGWQAPAPEQIAILPGTTASLDLTYSSPILQPILHLALEELSGPVAIDSSGAGRHGIYGARVALDLEGVAGRAVQSAGVGASAGTLADGIVVPSLATGVAYNEASLAFWYRLPAEPHDGYLLGWGGTNTAKNSISVFFDAGVGLRVRVHDASDSSSVVQLAPPGYDDTAWHHLVLVKESTGSRFYFDGQPAGVSALGSGSLAPQLGLFLGTNPIGAFGIEASFDEVLVYDRALTFEQVQALYDSGASPAAFGGDYLRTAEISQALFDARTRRPDLVEVIDFGDSYAKTQGGLFTPQGNFLAGHDLLVAKVGRGSSTGKPVMLLTGGLHAREIATPELVLHFLAWLVDGDGVDAEATWLLDHHLIYLAPLIDPDGHDLVEIGALAEYGSRPFRWRKNARPLAGCPWPPTATGFSSGVDLNRNFPFEWGLSNDRGGSSTPCDPYYRGPAATSEQETQALVALVASLIPDQRGPGALDAAPDNATGIFLQLHSPYRVVAWPWSHSGAPAPNGADLAAIGRQLASYGNYGAGQAHTILYEMSGTAENWVYGELGAASFLVEVGEGLMPAYSRIDNVLWPEIRDALIYAAKIADTPYLLSRGPVVSQVEANVLAGGLEIKAKAKDSQADPIVAGELYFDLPPWSEGASRLSLEAADGGFGGSEEDLLFAASAGGIPPGRHLVFVRARDQAGAWGPVSAAFVNLP